MKDVVIIGNTDYSKMLMDYLKDDGINTCAFAVNEPYIKEKYIFEIPVLPIEHLLENFNPTTTTLYMGIGYTKLGTIKKNLFDVCKSYGYSFENYIHKTACIDSGAILGEGNVIFEGVTVQKYTSIGNANLFFSNSTIMHNDNVGSYNTFGAGSVLNGFVNVGECNFIGANATLRNNISIGNLNLIGAGVYLNKRIENNTVVKLPTAIHIEGSMKFASRI